MILYYPGEGVVGIVCNFLFKFIHFYMPLVFNNSFHFNLVIYYIIFYSYCTTVNS